MKEHDSSSIILLCAPVWTRPHPPSHTYAYTHTHTPHATFITTPGLTHKLLLTHPPHTIFSLHHRIRFPPTCNSAEQRARSIAVLVGLTRWSPSHRCRRPQDDSGLHWRGKSRRMQRRRTNVSAGDARYAAYRL